MHDRLCVYVNQRWTLDHNTRSLRWIYATDRIALWHPLHSPDGRSVRLFLHFSKRVNYSTSITALLLILAGGETNPGPSIKIGSLNALSVVRKGPLVQDLINDHHLDALAICESWVVDDDPVVIKSGLAPNGYKVTHVPRLPRIRGEADCVLFTGTTSSLRITQYKSRSNILHSNASSWTSVSDTGVWQMASQSPTSIALHHPLRACFMMNSPTCWLSSVTSSRVIISWRAAISTAAATHPHPFQQIWKAC